jgi:hypothetical protein
MELLLFTAGLGLLSAATTALITKRLFTPCTWYWLGWIAGTISAQLAAQTNTLPAVTTFGQDLIIRAHVGAFIGFLLASVWARTLPLAKRPHPNWSRSPRPLLDRALWFLVLLQMIVGTILLAQRLAGVEITGVASIYDVRQSFLQDAYLQSSLPLPLRLYNYITLMAAIAPILLAQSDAKSGTINFRSLSLLFLASVPGGLSTGGRIWIATVFSLYLVSYFIALDRALSWKTVMRVGRFFLVPTIAVLTLFTLIGFVRDTVVQGTGISEETRASPVLTVLSPLYIYLGITVSAVGPYAEPATEQYSPGWGQYTFPWFASQIARLGLAQDTQYLDFVAGARMYVGRHVDMRIGTTHASIIPLLIADFKEENLPYAMVILMGLLQVVFLLFSRKPVWGYVLGTVICLYGGAFAFQDATIGTAAAALPILTGFGYAIWRSLRLRPANWTSAGHAGIYHSVAQFPPKF